MDIHNLKVKKIAKIIENTKKKITVIRNTNISKTLRNNRYKNNCEKINISELNNIIDINTEQNYIIMEPNITMEQIVIVLQKYKKSIPCVTEFKTMTIGGAIIGLGGESSSFKYGLIHNSVIDYEIIVDDGIIKNINNSDDLFYKIPGSYGSICLVTMLKIKLIDIKESVEINFIRCNEIPNNIFDNKDDFIDGVIINKDKYCIMYGNFVNKKATKSISNFYNYFFYDYVKDDNYKSLILSYYDYVFRWDRGAFFVTHNKNVSAIKAMFYSIINSIKYCNFTDISTSENLYLKAKQKSDIERESNSMYQDIIIPYNKIDDFILYINSELKIYPIWILPISENTKTDYGLNIGNYINFGIYGSIIHIHQNFIDINKNLENKIILLEGKKTLYNQSYYNENEFYKLYPYYESSKFENLYTKSCELYNSIKNYIPKINEEILIDQIDNNIYIELLKHYQIINILIEQLKNKN